MAQSAEMYSLAMYTVNGCKVRSSRSDHILYSMTYFVSDIGGHSTQTAANQTLLALAGPTTFLVSVVIIITLVVHSVILSALSFLV